MHRRTSASDVRLLLAEEGISCGSGCIPLSGAIKSLLLASWIIPSLMRTMQPRLDEHRGPPSAHQYHMASWMWYPENVTRDQASD